MPRIGPDSLSHPNPVSFVLFVPWRHRVNIKLQYLGMTWASSSPCPAAADYSWIASFPCLATDPVWSKQPRPEYRALLFLTVSHSLGADLQTA